MDDTSLPPGFELDVQAPVLTTEQTSNNIDNPYSDAPTVPMPEGFELDEDKYGTTGQQIKTGLEGIAKGVAGPLAPLIETKLLGVKPEDIRGRAETNPLIHGISEGAAFAGSLFLGTGEAQLLAKAGSGVSKLTEAGSLAGKAAEAANSLKLLQKAGAGAEEIAVASELANAAQKAAEASPLLSKIGAEALDQATQMALLQGGDEISKRIVEDPSATAENAIANIGLAAALGGTIGAGIGAISPLFKTGALKTNKLLNEFKDEAAWATANKSPIKSASEELENLVTGTQALKESLYSNGLKGELISAKLPPLTVEHTAKLQQEMGNISEMVRKAADDAAESAFTKGAAPYLEQHAKDFEAKLLRANTYEDGYNALNELKRGLQADAKAGKAFGAHPEASARGEIAAKLQAKLVPVLENEAMWGEAGKIQKTFNEAYSTFSKSAAEKDFLKTFTREVGGERVIDPAKIETFIKQAGSPKAEIKNEILTNYVKEHQAFADKINKAAVEAGMNPIVPHNNTAVLNKLTGTKTEGAKLFQALISKIGDETAGAAIAAGAGGLAFGPLGALVGERIAGGTITKALNGLTKSILERESSATGLKSAIDFVSKAIKGETTLNKAVNGVFKGSMAAGVIAINQPSAEERAKLDKIVTKIQNNPESIANINSGNVAHYIPNHQTAMSETNARAVQYLSQLKPRPFKSSPLDKEIEPSDMEKSRYNRALDIAHSPINVLSHIKAGTLQASDVQDLQAMYPSLYKQMVMKLSNEITTMTGAGQDVPYKTRVSLSLFMGQALDSTMQPASIQAAHASLQAKANQQQQGPPPGASKQTAKLGKTTASYMTPLQSSEQQDTKRK